MEYGDGRSEISVAHREITEWKEQIVLKTTVLYA